MGFDWLLFVIAFVQVLFISSHIGAQWGAGQTGRQLTSAN